MKPVMASHTLHNALLRPAIIQILRAAGFNSTRSNVLDSLAELVIAYVRVLASKSLEWALHNHQEPIPDVRDVRLALQDVGAFRPGSNFLEETRRDAEDTRGTEAFIAWFSGPDYGEILRVAGFSESEAAVGMDIDNKTDYLTALKKKHSKTGEESRYKGTLLGKNADEQEIDVEGGGLETLSSWFTLQMESCRSVASGPETPSSGISSVPDSISEPRDYSNHANR